MQMATNSVNDGYPFGPAQVEVGFEGNSQAIRSRISNGLRFRQPEMSCRFGVGWA